MDANKIKCLLVGMGVVMLLTASAGRHTRSSIREGFRFDASELKDKTLWAQVNTKPYYISSAADALCRAPTRGDYEAERKRNPHAATYITVYVNQVGREAMFAKEPHWMHGKRAVVEPERKLTAKELVGRVCAYLWL